MSDYRCQWEECQRPAKYTGLGRFNLMLCTVHFPEHLSQVQRDLNEAVGAVHRALDAVAKADTLDNEV